MLNTVNSLPNDISIDWSTLTTLAEDKINVTEKFKFAMGWVENVGKVENAVYQHFLLFPQCFQKASFSKLLK